MASDLTAYPHTGDPGRTGGTANRIPGVAGVAMPARQWSDAVDGDVVYNASLDFVMLSATRNLTPNWLSLFRGNAYVADIPLGAGAVIPSGEGFRVRSGTIRINGAS